MSVAGVGRRSPPTRQARRVDKDDFLFFLGRADEEKAPHLAVEAARRAGRRLVMCATTKNERERERAYWAANVEPILGDDVEVHGECSHEQKTDLLARASASSIRAACGPGSPSGSPPTPWWRATRTSTSEY